ncbi:hypothetical protein [Paraferrimonas sp. SM1919]|uniref:hypothetical protein n=1 Tax=Paraferrimonas sp. SM1919 TaxID=2662263 RepID=UPI0013D127F4|nr:hypothetical protein [Paraferrimonas sp. SM1919]
MKSSMFIFMFMFLSFSGNTQEVDFNNGCGTDWNEHLVPETISSLNLDFTKACAAHDNCYSRCLEGGKWFNEGICDETHNRKARKKVCDVDFRNTMYESCIQKSYFKESMCKGLGAIYYTAVLVAGGGSFDGKEVNDYLKHISNLDENFDVESFERDLLAMVSQPGFDSAQEINLSINNSDILIKFGGKEDITTLLNETESSKVFKIETIRYGNVYISNMKLNGSNAKLDTLNLKGLDLNKFKQQSKLSVK